MYRLVARIYPRKLRHVFYQLFSYANIMTDNDNFLGFVTSLIALFSLALGFFAGMIFGVKFFLITIISVVVLTSAFYFWLLVNADKKAKYIEEILSDALFLMASNLRSGFTVDKAMLLSARDEFGPFKDELVVVSKEIATGKSIEKSLEELMKRVRSEKLEKAFTLIVSGLKSGGRLADLLQETANDLKNQKLVDKKIRASVNMYAIFIFIATGVGAPLLFGLSSFLVKVLTATLSSVEIPTAVSGAFGVPIAIKAGGITEAFVIGFAMLCIITTALFGSFIVGLIRKGKEKEGVVLIPVLVLLSLAVFFFVRLFVQLTIGTLFSV